MASIRELQPLIQDLDSKYYNCLFGRFSSLQHPVDNDSHRRSTRTRKPPTRYANAAVAKPSEVEADTSPSELKSSHIESSESVLREKREENGGVRA